MLTREPTHQLTREQTHPDTRIEIRKDVSRGKLRVEELQLTDGAKRKLKLSKGFLVQKKQ